MGWDRRSPMMLPLGLGIGRTLVRPWLPPMSLFSTGQWMVNRQFAPAAPQTTINFGLTVAFPNSQTAGVARLIRIPSEAPVEGD